MYTWISIGIIVAVLTIVHLTSRNRLDLPGIYLMRRISMQLGVYTIFVLLVAYYTDTDIRFALAVWFSNMLTSWRTIAFTVFVLPFEAIAILSLSFIRSGRDVIL